MKTFLAIFTSIIIGVSAMAAIKHVDDKSFHKEVIEAKGLVLVDFYASWCGPCRSLAQILLEVDRLDIEGFKIVKVDVDKEAWLSDKYRVRALPTIVLFKDGKEVGRMVGLPDKEELIKFIKERL